MALLFHINNLKHLSLFQILKKIINYNIDEITLHIKIS